MVWEDGFEPPASWIQTRHSGQTELLPDGGRPGRFRTVDLTIIGRVLCQLSYRSEVGGPDENRTRTPLVDNQVLYRRLSYRAR